MCESVEFPRAGRFLGHDPGMINLEDSPLESWPDSWAAGLDFDAKS